MDIGHSIWVVMRVALLAYAGVCLFMMGCQRSLMYFPVNGSEREVITFADARGFVPWRDGDGRMLGWKPAGEAARTHKDAVLIFHGNGGMAAQRDYLVEGFSRRFDVRMMEYPGYGSRPGRTTEKNIQQAAEEALRVLEKEREGRVFVVGESLGSGVAAWLAGANPDRVAGLLLITPFDSALAVARAHYPFLPVGLLMLDRYESVKHLENYRGPVAVLIAGRDEVIPARHGHALYDAYAGPKRRWVQEDRSHNNVNFEPGAAWWGEVMDFLVSGGVGE